MLNKAKNAFLFSVMVEGTIQIPEGKVGFDDETPTGEKNTKQKQIKNKLLRISVCETQRRKLQTAFLFIAMDFFYLWRKVLSYHPEANLILKMTLLHAYVKN